MKNILIFFFLFIALTINAQSGDIKTLEKELKETRDSKTKMVLNYRLAELYLSKDAKKASDYAHQAHLMGDDLKDYSMMAQSSFINARAQVNQRNLKGASIRFNRSLKFAKLANDYDLILKNVDKLGEMALKKRDYRKAYEVNREALDYLSKQGLNNAEIKALERDLEIERSKLTKEKRDLQKEKLILVNEISNLEKEKNEIQKDSKKFKKKSEKLSVEKESIEKTVSEQEAEILTIAEQKEKKERELSQKKRRIVQLSKEALADSLALQENEVKLTRAELQSSRNKNLRNLLIFISSFVLALAALFYGRYKSKQKSHSVLEEKNKIIEEERTRSDELLLNILPESIAHELKEKGKVAAKKYNDATVLFSDFKNFTKIAEQLSPEELVQELDYCFKGFDFIISQYDSIEKIKTIGDAYMCASGLSDKTSLPKDIVNAALEMQEFLKDYKKTRISENKLYFEARIGLHTGAVVAGVVGIDKYAYDIWGDTVNLASRMESQSEVGYVNISESTYNKIKYSFDCRHRGKIAAKNKGEMDMYYVVTSL